MYEYFVDFQGCSSATDVHERIRRGLKLPDYYGANLDALWDCLTGMIGLPAFIYVSGAREAAADAQAEISRALAVLEEADAAEPDIILMKEHYIPEEEEEDTPL